MKTYQISVDNFTGNAPCPDVLPVEGQELTIVVPFVTLARKMYFAGDKLKLVRRTKQAPHGRVSSLGNWVVQCPHMISIWTNIEWMMAEGTVK